MKPRSHTPRLALDKAVKVLSAFSALIGIVFLAWILGVVVKRGAAAINWGFFTQLPPNPNETGGGVGNAIVGTLLMTGLAALIGVPIGLMAGVYLSEVGRTSRFAHAVRFFTNVMMGVPSIIIGLFVYTLLVLPKPGFAGGFSGYAGAAALALLILPIVSRTTEDMLALVPNALRESALALGAPQWRMTLGIVFRSARVGLLTGVMLAIARVSGETAPLLFTALNSPYWPRALHEPTGNLTVTIWNFAMSPFENLKQAAWGASLLITLGVLMMTITVRFVFRETRR